MSRPTAFVRSASVRDLPAIFALLERSIESPKDVGESGNPPIASSVLKGWLDRQQSEFIVADDGAEIVGAGYAAMVDERTSALELLCVDPVARRVGNGSELLAELMQAFPTARRMMVDVPVGNEGALTFVRRHGFARTGDDVATDAQTLTMALDLV